jgi:hypothetical protein
MRPGFESPWGRHFLRVCQKRIVRRCKRKKFQGFTNFGRFYGRKYHKFDIAISGDVSRSFLMTYTGVARVRSPLGHRLQVFGRRGPLRF